MTRILAREQALPGDIPSDEVVLAAVQAGRRGESKGNSIAVRSLERGARYLRKAVFD